MEGLSSASEAVAQNCTISPIHDQHHRRRMICSNFVTQSLGKIMVDKCRFRRINLKSFFEVAIRPLLPAINPKTFRKLVAARLRW